MGRIIAGVVAAVAFCALTGTAFAHKGFYVGGGYASTAASGDLDGKDQVTNSAGDRLGSIGDLDTGAGINLNVGYNFNDHIGVEIFGTSTAHTSKNLGEAKKSDSGVVNASYGFRFTAPVNDAFDLFARLGYATSAVTYDKFGHQGTTTAGVFTAVSDKGFVISGTGMAYGVGFDIYSGRHLGIGVGYTVFNVKYTQGSIDNETRSSLPKDLSESLNTTDVTITWHF